MKNAMVILNTLIKEGFEAYIVGGAVRDMLMKKTPSDIDITTNALPDEVIQLFPIVIPTGKKYGTVTVMLNGEGYEVTTFRTDGKYIDGRRPEIVIFGKSIEEDLSRRDFTINAMAIDINGNILDIFGGKEDIKNKIIKAVGNSKERFFEDALRILRAFRFSARFGFKVESITLMSINETKAGLRLISPERIREEITKILLTDNVVEIFSLMQKTGVLEIILPEISNMYGVEQNHPYHIYDIFTHTLKSVENAPKIAELRWAMLLHDTGKPAVKESVDGVDRFIGHQEVSAEIANVLLSRLNFSNREKDKIIELVLLHDREILASPKAIRRIVSKLKFSTIEELIFVKEADTLAQEPNKAMLKQKNLAKAKLIASQEPKLSIKDLAVNGYDMMNLGFKGKEIGEILKQLLEIVLDNPGINNKSSLIEFAKKASNL